MKQEIIADLSRITEEEQAILDGKTEVEKERYSSGQKFVMDAGKLLERGKLIDIRPHTRFIRFPAHSHNYVEMIYMCQGSTVHTINGERIELKTGELLILNQNAVQEIEPAGRDDIAVNFLILPEFFDQTLRMIGAEENQLKDFIVGCLKSGEVPLCYLHYRIADVLPVQNLIENLVWTLLHHQSNKRSINQITMGLLFLQLMNYTERVQVGEQYFEQEMLLGVYRYIEEHYRGRNRTPALRSSSGVGSSSSPRSGALRRMKHSSAAAPAKLAMAMIIMRRMPNIAYSTPPRKLGSRLLSCWT